MNFSPSKAHVEIMNDINQDIVSHSHRIYLEALFYKIWSDTIYFLEDTDQLIVILDDENDMNFLSDEFIKLGARIMIQSKHHIQFPKNNIALYMFVGDEVRKRPTYINVTKAYFSLGNFNYTPQEQVEIIRQIRNKNLYNSSKNNIVGVSQQILDKVKI